MTMLLHVTVTAEMIMSTTTSARVQKHRAGLRKSGLRPVQIWVADTRRPGFAEECRRQSQLVQGDAHERETADWLEAAADREDWQ